MILLVSAFLPGVHFQTQAKQTQEELSALQQKIAATESLLLTQSELREQLNVRRTALRVLDQSLSSPSHWTQFFQELQEKLYNVGDVWLDELEVSRRTTLVEAPIPEDPVYDEYGELVVPEPVEMTTYRLHLNGKMLLRESTAAGDSPIGKDYDEQVISNRIRSMIAQFGESAFIEKSGVPTIFWTRLEDGILPFSFNLTVNPEKPL